VPVETNLDCFRGDPYHYNLERSLYNKNVNASGKEIAVLTDFFRMILQINPDDRCTLDEISNHRWLQLKV
jgi:hypothetical protein